MGRRFKNKDGEVVETVKTGETVEVEKVEEEKKPKSTEEMLESLCEEAKSINDNLLKVNKTQIFLEFMVLILAVVIGALAAGLFFLTFSSMYMDTATSNETEVTTEAFDLTSVNDIVLEDCIFEYSGKTYNDVSELSERISGNYELVTLINNSDRYDCLVYVDEKYEKPELYYQGGTFRLRLPKGVSSNE